MDVTHLVIIILLVGAVYLLWQRREKFGIPSLGKACVQQCMIGNIRYYDPQQDDIKALDTGCKKSCASNQQQTCMEGCLSECSYMMPYGDIDYSRKCGNKCAQICQGKR